MNAESSDTDQHGFTKRHAFWNWPRFCFSYVVAATQFIYFLSWFFIITDCLYKLVNLTTARASLRAKEVSIRKMTGAKSFWSFLTIHCRISNDQFAIINYDTYSYTTLLTRIQSINRQNVYITAYISRIMAGIVNYTVYIIVLNSIYPALLLSSFKPLNVFRGNTVLKVKDSSFRKGLVVLQFAVSVILIAVL